MTRGVFESSLQSRSLCVCVPARATDMSDPPAARGFRMIRLTINENLRPSMVIEDLPFIPIVRRFVVEKYRQISDFAKLMFTWRTDIWNIIMALTGLTILLLYIHYKKSRCRRKIE